MIGPLLRLRVRLLAVVAATALIAAAFVATAARRAEAQGDVASPEQPTPEVQASVARPPTAQPAASTDAAKRQRVTPGVLARAASRRAHEREASSPSAPEERRDDAGGAESRIVSVEIDWNAGNVPP